MIEFIESSLVSARRWRHQGELLTAQRGMVQRHPEHEPPMREPEPPRPAERDPEPYPPPAPIEDPPVEPGEPGEPAPDIREPVSPPEPAELPSEPVAT